MLKIQYTTTDQHGDVHTMLNMDHHGDDAEVVDVGHMETVTVSVGGQEHRQLIVPATRHITLNESDAAAFADATMNGENVQIVQIQIQDDDGEDQKHWFNIIQPQQG